MEIVLPTDGICPLIEQFRIMDYYVSHVHLVCSLINWDCYCLEFASRVHIYFFTQQICASLRIVWHGGGSCCARSGRVVSDVECALFIRFAKSNSVSAGVDFVPADAVYWVDRGKLYFVHFACRACDTAEFNHSVYRIRWDGIIISGHSLFANKKEKQSGCATNHPLKYLQKRKCSFQSYPYLL